ncbi:unnamed protein product [Urochloa decumbens]|uniref:Uncharacterized protein n=1 Tax=Urochloa decumbens TaxID=240449 RepID=A0ABC9CNB5_9POAL
MAALQADIARPLTDRAHMHRDQEANVPNNGREADNGSFSWPIFVCFLFLTFNSVMAIIRAQGEMMAVAFVSFSYVDLVVLFVFLRMYERAPAGSGKRGWLKIGIWTLTTLLTFAFSYKVAAVMPPLVAVFVWIMAFTTVAGGFLAFFIYKEK